ncbi:type IV pilus secretin PilQ [uncultured Cedecea sp.]|uniref:type IV pilus secretin PilQ n=1 Tax=uncultured Cedecea sp. TaxID=988762 RepID=UPI0026029EEC|nr:type IV pilus secretin PilQ [uncultured Cedecea sp.]
MTRKVVIVLLLCLPLITRANHRVTLIADDAPVTQILQAIAEQQQHNLVIAPGVEGRLSLHLVDVPWEQAFSLVLKLAHLSSSKTGNILQVQGKESVARQQEQLEVARKQQLEARPLVHKVYTPRYADVTELATALKQNGDKLLGPKGYVTVDTRTNRLVVRDSKQAQQQIAQWLADMDIPMGQIELSAHIVTINQEALRELGIKWTTKTSSSELYRPSTATSHLVAGVASAGFNIGRIGGQMLELELSALEQQQRLQIIASPRLLVAHQQSASIKQGTEIPYQVSGGANSASSVAFKEAVLGMEVTPVINAHGNIRLKLRITQNMPGRSIQHAEGEALAIDKQEIETQVEVLDGETLVLGGIFQQQQRAGSRNVPLLGDIPLIGRLFHQDDKKSHRQELVVFITSKLLRKL